jgi:hypothetical protein
LEIEDIEDTAMNKPGNKNWREGVLFDVFKIIPIFIAIPPSNIYLLLIYSHSS